MTTLFKILYNTKDTFNDLDNQFEDRLGRNCIFIFMIVGAISGFGSFYRELENIREYIEQDGIFILWILFVALVAVFGVLFGYLFTFLLYGMSRLFKGRGELIDIRVVAAYSMVPMILKLPVVLYLGMSDKFSGITGMEYWIINIFYFLIWIWSMKILVLGFMRFNKFSLKKALLILIPLWILGLGSYFIV